MCQSVNELHRVTFIMKLTVVTNLENTDGLLHRRNRYQLLATFIASLSTFSHGVGIGWMAPTMRELQTEDSPLTFAVYVEEISWIGSLLGIGSIIGNLIAGFLQDRIGRKPVMYGLAVPYLCFWLLSFFAQSVEYLYVGRLLAGITGGGGYIVLPIFISEISDAKTRGRLGSMIMVSVNTGVLVGYILATNVDYFMAPLFIIPLPICYIVGNLFLPETPFFLIRNGKFDAAEKSFRFYKNIKQTDKTSMVEFDDIKQALTHEENSKNYTFQDFTSRKAFKAYATAMVLLLANQFTGTFCFTTYAADIFEISHSTLDVGMSTIVIGVVQIIGTLTTILLCDRFGRKILLLISSMGACLCLAAFGIFIYFAERYDLSFVDWLPLVILSVNIFLSHAGLVGILFVVIVEALPAKIRSVAASTIIIILSVLVFTTLKIFPLCLKYWGLAMTMWAASLVGFLAFIYFILFFDETKGKSMLDP